MTTSLALRLQVLRALRSRSITAGCLFSLQVTELLPCSCEKISMFIYTVGAGAKTLQVDPKP